MPRHMPADLGEVRLAHHAASLAPYSSVEHRDHALMAASHQCVELRLGTGHHRYTLILGQLAKRLHALVLTVCLHMECRNATRLSADQALNGVVTKYGVSHCSPSLLTRWQFFTRAALRARGLAHLGSVCGPA